MLKHIKCYAEGDRKEGDLRCWKTNLALKYIVDYN